ncbi:hypothetical protein L1049_009210 [Liquidambar formosana]|uniref:cysteine dioxygenase n=1 Tax=Liquidambar formosana TaxID=63359 RepID=A0AAP0S5P3_LIQFO
MEAGLVEQRRDGVGYVNNKVIRKRRCKQRKKRRGESPPMEVSITLQKLFLSCQNVFKGPGTVPCACDVQTLCHILDHMKPEDVGLTKDLQFFKPKTAVEPNPIVKYTTIYKCKNFSLCIFFLPATAVIPLHNHPGMTVFSKLLLGTMHIKSYDWVDPVDLDGSAPSSPLRLARLKANRDFIAPCDTSVLYPTSGGNMHSFTAITPCAVLDVLGPPYSKEDGRDCTYYKDIPYTAFSNVETAVATDSDCYGWLEEIEMPVDSQMEGIEYMGPQIIETNF